MLDLLYHIRNGTFKDQILTLRELRKTDQEAYKQAKLNLPSFNPAGKFKDSTAKGLLEYSEEAGIDIDGKDNPQITDWPKQRDELAKIGNVSFCTLTPSGEGIFCMVRTTNDPEMYKKHFNALRECFESLGIIIDKSCSNINRRRFMTYDPDCYIAEGEVIPFTRVLDKIPSKKKTITPSSTNKFSYSKNKPEDTLSKVEAIVDKIESRGIDITGDHGQWLRLGFALAREFGEDGRDLFDRISRQSPLYDKTITTDEQFTRCLNSESTGAEVTIGTFFHIAKEAGVY